jgi:hypothetical protein
MKVFRVVTERDGKTVKAPGVSETEIKREEWRYAADSIEQVWDCIARFITDPECTVIAMHEEHPAITILAASPNADGQQGGKG